MKNIFFFLIVLLFNTAISVAQDTSLLKRASYKLTLSVDKKTFYEQQIPVSNYILPDNTIQLYPGELVYIEVEQTGGVINKMIAVNAIRDSAKTITIGFSQEVKGKIHDFMMLKVVNPFPYNLIYKASIYILSQKKWISTDVYPVEAQLSAYETWPDVITSIGLGDWKLRSK